MSAIDQVNSGQQIGELGALFQQRLQRDPRQALIVQAPGRLNLLGEHTDYNDGFVLPIAINRSTLVVAAPARGQVRVWSEAMQELDVFDPAEAAHNTEHLWANYVRAVVWVLGQIGVHVPGADILLAGDLPLGAGVSSSASLEVAVALALLNLQHHDLPRRDLALLCQRAENEFVGVRCGIMDQFSVALSQKNHALLLDCLTLDTRQVPLNGDAPVFFVCDTSRPRTLAASAYNQRRAECEAAAKHLGADTLRHVSPEMLEQEKAALGEVVYRRCRHVLSENARVEQAVGLMSTGGWEEVGRLINDSHFSLRDDYEVSCEELDAMCALAREYPGCLGARMVGAGFGGAAMAAVLSDSAQGFVEAVGPAYREATGRQPRIFAVQAGGGARVIT